MFCECGCGQNTTLIDRTNTRAKQVKGNYMRFVRGHSCATHFLSGTKEHRCWKSMITRCSNPKQKTWKDYGGRGITVCDRWRQSFENFLADVGPAPSSGHQIDRYPNNNGNYEPGNVRWATRSEQCRNRRDNSLLTHDGRMMTVAGWAEEIGIAARTIHARLYKGWSAHRTLSTPLGGRAWQPMA